MSASLVGSEMCIRDRTGSPRIDPLSARQADAKDPERAHCHRPAPGTPVSYTHLTLPTICSV
eukprot:1990464-Alexandrium_andersonii.AAC.1